MKYTEQYVIRYNFKDGEYWKIGETEIITVEYTEKNMKDNHQEAENKFIRELKEKSIKEYKIIRVEYI